jgi:hypothetical protein
MKKVSLLFAGVLFLLLSPGVNAQSKTGADFFVGKWNILMKGTPLGDLRRTYIFEEKGNILTGAVQHTNGEEIAKFSKVELKDNQMTIYYRSHGRDINVSLNKKDEDHFTGRVNGMFDIEGERMKEIR